MFEQYHFGTASQLLAEFEKTPQKVKGEMVVLISSTAFDRRSDEESNTEGED